jgi:hypothetical protein
VPDNLSASLELYKYILLNPDYEDYQWKLHVFVNSLIKKVEIEIISRPKLGNADFILIDNQK